MSAKAQIAVYVILLLLLLVVRSGGHRHHPHEPSSVPNHCKKSDACKHRHVCTQEWFLSLISFICSAFVTWVVLRVITIKSFSCCGSKVDPVCAEIIGLILFVVGSVLEYTESEWIRHRCHEPYDIYEAAGPWFEAAGCLLYLTVLTVEMKWKQLHWSLHVVPFVVMLGSSVCAVLGILHADSEECDRRAYMMSDIFDGLGLGCFVLGGLMERHWEPTTMPKAQNNVIRRLFGVPRAVEQAISVQSKEGENVETEENVGLWKDTILCRLDFTGCAFLLVSVTIPWIYLICSRFARRERTRVWVEFVGVILFLLYSSVEKREVEDEFLDSVASTDNNSLKLAQLSKPLIRNTY